MVAAIAAIWSQAKSIWLSVSSYAIVRVEVDWDASVMISEWVKKNAKRSPFGLISVGGIVVTMRSTGIDAWHFREFIHDGGLFWVGWRPVWYSKSVSSHGSITRLISYVRGTFDLSTILKEASALRNDGRNQSGRWKVKEVMGRDKSISVLSSGPQPTGSVNSADDLKYARLITCSESDVSIGVKATDLEDLLISKGCHELVEKFNWWLSNRRWYADRGIPWKFGATLHGAPGTGKTAFIRSLAVKNDLPIWLFDLSTMSSNELVESWRDCCADSPCIAVFDDIDNVFDKTKVLKENSSLSFDTFLQCLSGVKEVDGVASFVTTNFIDKVAESVLRPGRAGIVVEFGMLDHQRAMAIASRFLAGFEESIISDAAKSCVGRPVAELVDRCICTALSSREGVFN